ncbi:hypothetical protein [Flavobacterium akiainvivens]|uniref:hypothetical protein n=1 Tax=Flavobacterium akiainvivens TaxID=1202724 RepID=UPI0011606003|nr:hypothetical protein [Flavobacterium akiainvivens]
MKYFTKNNSKVKTADLFGRTFKVRKMSNNDNVPSYILYVKDLEKSSHPYFISAFSPDEKKNAGYFLSKIKQVADLHIFVQLHGYKGGKLSTDDIKLLRLYDENLVILEEKLEAKDRADKFLAFIKKNLDNFKNYN